MANNNNIIASDETSLSRFGILAPAEIENGATNIWRHEVRTSVLTSYVYSYVRGYLFVLGVRVLVSERE